MSSHTDTTTTSYINENGIRCAKPVRLKLCEFQDCEKEGKHKACGWNLCLEHVLEVFGVGGKSGKKRVKEIFNQEIQKAREEERETIKLKVQEWCTAPLDGVTDHDQRIFRMGINECKSRVVGLINSLSNQSKEKV